MCLIGVPNMKEIDPEEGYFWLKVVVVNRFEEENVKKIDNFQKHISRKLLSQFYLNVVYKVIYVYKGHKLCEFDINWSSGVRHKRY